MIRLLCFSFLFLLTTQTFSQNKTISGQVKDATGSPMAGVSVLISGSNKGTTTNEKGDFALSVAGNSTLIISSTGYVTQEVNVKNITSLQITLNIESSNLSDVVVVGYGTQKKRDLTGAVRRINLEGSPLANSTNVNVLSALQGTPGVNVGPIASAGGSPGILIRGQRSLAASNAPLIILDGVIFSGNLNEINTQDIASFDVLMDASSAAIYGSRAANGVIIITTKVGKSGKPIINISNNYGIQSWTRKPEMRFNDDFIEWRRYNRKLAGQADLSIEKILDPKEVIAYKAGQNVDWLDEITQYAPLNDLNMSVSGKSDNINYYVSGSFLDQKGVIFNDKFKKYNIASKVDVKITKWLTAGLNYYYSTRDYSGLTPNLVMATTNTPYAYKWLDESRNILDRYPAPANILNPFWDIQYRDNLEKFTSTRTIGYLSADIPYVKGLNFRMNITKNKSETVSGNFIHETEFINPDNPADIANQAKFLVNTSGSMSNTVDASWEIQNLLTYKKSFNNHNLDLLAGYQRDYRSISTLSSSASDFAGAGTTVLGFYGLHLGNPANQRASSRINERSNLGYLGRINYNYKSKYYLTGNYRRDGYSAFAPGNKFADFYGGALAYAISEENFFKRILPKVNYLKFRLGYGQNGNQGIDPYETLSNIGSGSTVFGSTTTLFISQSNLPNQKLSWETTTTLNLGLNFTAFDNRISGDLNIYSSQTTDQLLTRTIPFLTGYNSVRTNIGRVDNKGIEASLTGVVLKPEKPNGLRWEVTLNVWKNRNKIVHLLGADADGDGIEDDDLGNRWFIGKPISAIYDYRVDGIVQTGDLDYINKYGAKPGDLKILDINGTKRGDGLPDGKLNSLDRTIIGYGQPNFSWSFANTVAYKNWQLYFNINAIMGGGKNNYYRAGNNSYFLGAFGNNQQQNWLNKPYWTPETPTNKFTRPNYSNPYGYGYNDARQFIRLQDISLQYSLIQPQLDKLKIKGLRIYVSARNPIVFTKWLGADPENAGGLAASPVFTTINFGTNLTF